MVPEVHLQIFKSPILTQFATVAEFFSSPQCQSQGYPFGILHTNFLPFPINKTSPQSSFSGLPLTEFDLMIKHSSLLQYLFA